MRIDELVVALQKRRTQLEGEIFKVPPQDYQEFVKRLGVWMGLGDSLSVIEDARKKEMTDDA